MFDIGWPEMAVVAVIALIIIGPKDLPRIMRWVGGWAGKARGMARQFQRSIDDMVREAELDEVKKSVDSVSKFNPTQELDKSIDPTGSVKKALDPSALDDTEAGAAKPAESTASGDEPKAESPQAETPKAETPVVEPSKTQASA
ncbi:MAG: Sec-independent protein translocase protein TatB [Alphaproteobacteria bacterium]